MKKIDMILSDYINMIGGQNISRTEKIAKLIDQIIGDGNKNKIGGNKKVISIKTNELSENNIIENPIDFKNYLFKLSKSQNNIVHEFFSSSENL
jgi:predicted transcriptional regulator